MAWASRARGFCLLVLAACVGAASAQSKIAVDQRPITKVVTLLGEMKAQVEKEAKEDLAAYDKYNCWCETNEKEKTEAIANAEQRISELSAFIEEAAARQGELKTEIEGLAADIAEDTEALKTATATREKEHAAFLTNEADMKETRGLLGQAVEVLSGVQLAQTSSHSVAPSKQMGAAQALIQVRDRIQKTADTVRHQLSKKTRHFQNMMQEDLFDVLGSLQEVAQEHGGGKSTFLQQRRRSLPWEKTEEEIGMEKKPNALEGAVAGAKSYNARSGRILGILDEMQAEFTRDLGAAQKADYVAEVSFQKLRAAKLSEIAAATEQKELKEEELADSMYKSAKAQENMESVQKSADADKKFLTQLKKLCTEATEEYNTRVKERSEEIRALGEALAMLTEDEARFLFGKTMSFLQVATRKSGRAAISQAQRTKLQKNAAKRAMRRLAKIALKNGNLAMASLATRIKLDAFTKVKAAMDKMLVELQAQQKEEYEKWEFCKKEIDKTEDAIWVATNTKTDLSNKHTELTNTIKTITTNTEMLKQEVADMEISLKKAGEERHEENKLFQQSMLDQRAMINLLQKVLVRLEQFYSTNAPSFVQAGDRYDPPPPPKPKGYTKSGTAGGVLQLLHMIINEAEVAEKDLAMGEQKAQEDYAAFVQVTTESITADRASIQEKTGQIASNSATLSETEEAQMANDAELAELKDMLHAHHLDCDYLLKFFDQRQTARAEEMDAIKDAKAILSGANYS